jgi:hypothetical protein
MNVQVKHAWFNLTVCGVVFLLTAVAYSLVTVLIGPRGSWGAFGFLGLLGLLGFSRLFYRRRPDEPGVLTDERDTHIRDRADLVGWRVVWAYWSILCMGVWSVVVLSRGVDAVGTVGVPVFWLPIAYMGAFVVHEIAWSATVLVQYGRSGETHDD